jgi:hypothetical protein
VRASRSYTKCPLRPCLVPKNFQDFPSHQMFNIYMEY